MYILNNCFLCIVIKGKIYLIKYFKIILKENYDEYINIWIIKKIYLYNIFNILKILNNIGLYIIINFYNL